MAAGVISAALVGGYAASGGGGGGEVTITGISDPTGGEIITTGDPDNYNMGTRFQVSAAATCNKIRLYRVANDGARTGRVWNLTSTTPIATVSIPDNTGNGAGWYEYAFSSPPSLTASTNYIVGYSRTGTAPNQAYYSRSGVFTSAALTNGILTCPQQTADDNASNRNGLFDSGGTADTNRPFAQFSQSLYFVFPVVQAT
jgi:hypothetical protein